MPQLRNRPTSLHRFRVLACWPCCHLFRYILQTVSSLSCWSASSIACGCGPAAAAGYWWIALLPGIADFAPEPCLLAPPIALPGGLERKSEETAAKRTKTSTNASKSNSTNTKSNTTTGTNTTTTKTRRLATRVRKRTSTLLRSKSWKKRTKRARTRTRVRRGREWGDRVEVPMIRRASCACHCYCPGFDLVLRTLLIIKYDGTALETITCNLTRQKASRCPQLRCLFPPSQHAPRMRRNYGSLRYRESNLLCKTSQCFVVHELRNCGSVSSFVRLHQTLRPACKDRRPFITVLC